MQMTDPDRYTVPGDWSDIALEDLMGAYVNARATYYTCGGHWRAQRAKQAMGLLEQAIRKRGLEPVMEEPRRPSVVSRWQTVTPS